MVHIKIILRSASRCKPADRSTIANLLSKKLIDLEINPKLIKDSRKRVGMISNYCQIMHSLVSSKYFEDMDVYKVILATIKDLSEQFTDFIKPRDL